ncbi:MAG: hypothetical protein KGN34_00325 [Sphingomonadales bacterium]|nr:hypothetical protein [Sphingomonadales bacterium]
MTRSINVATEDELSETVACRLIRELMPDVIVGLRLRKNGAGYLKSKMSNFCQMARREPVLVITDLDRIHCAPKLRADWTRGLDIPTKMLFRIAVREIESWILADARGFSKLLGIPVAQVPKNPDDIPDPKETLINLAKRSSKGVRMDLVATRGTIASQGIGYNRIICRFVDENWSIREAAENSVSLSKAVARIQELNET